MSIDYFVSYVAADDAILTHGNAQISRDGPLTHVEHVKEMEQFIEAHTGLQNVSITHWQRFEAPKPKLYRATLKTREQMEFDIPRESLGWWHDVCPGVTLKLREATAADIERCYVREGKTRDPADYLCENIPSGSLVLRAAIAELTEIHA